MAAALHEQTCVCLALVRNAFNVAVCACVVGGGRVFTREEAGSMLASTHAQAWLGNRLGRPGRSVFVLKFSGAPGRSFVLGKKEAQYTLGP